MDKNTQNEKCKNSIDAHNGSYAMQSEGFATGASEIKPKDAEGAVKKRKSTGSKAKLDSNFPSQNSPDLKHSKSKGRNKNFTTKSVDSAFSETPKHKRSSRRVVSSDVSDVCSDFSAKMNSSDNMRNTKQNRRSSVPNNNAEPPVVGGMSAFSFSPSAKESKIPQRKNSFRSKTPDCQTTPNKPVRKSNSFKKNFKFEPYIPLFQVQQGLKRGEFIEGALRINPRNYEDAYVNSPDGNMDIYIGGMHDRNRALNGDSVVVQVNPKQEWKVLCDAIKDYQEKSGESVAETVCRPMPSPPCKIHTPDKFLKSRPVSSNSWGSTYGERFPDTVEILGLDKLAKQLDELSVDKKGSPKGKSKRKSKSGQSFRDQSGKTSASYSQESSEDCLDKVSPNNDQAAQGSLNFNKAVGSYEGTLDGNSPVVSDLKTSENEVVYPVCDMNEIGMFEVDVDQNHGSNQGWEADESMLNIIVSPEELLDIEGDSLVDPENLLKWKSNDSGSEIDGIIVPPGDLSGDEFTDSASIGSTQSQSMELVIEDAAFLTCQQDADNNNIELSNNYNDIVVNRISTGYISASSSVTSREKSLELECRMQHNKTIPPLSCIEVSAETVVCSTVSEIPLSHDHSSSDENINAHPLVIGEFHAVDHVVELDEPPLTSNKKARQRKKKSKNKEKKAKEKIIPNLECRTFDIANLTIDDLLKHPEWPRFIQKTGKVVHILERKHSCIAAGHLKLCPDKNQKYALFSPNDSRVPRIMVPMSDCPQNFYLRPQDYAKFLFLAEIIEWNETSTFAAGRLIKHLGSAGDIEAETCGILVENGIDDIDFPEEVLNCLPQDEDWKVPLREINRRQDFRQQCVFTIDPATAADMDDAMSCTVMSNGNYKVGVHIADVTYFVEERTPLDEYAKARSTSVYLVQKMIPMLPRTLCSNLCSLTPGKDRLTFSVVWEMTPEGDIVRQWMGRSVINSCIKLSYEHAQSMIDSTSTDVDAIEYPELFGGFCISDVARRVRELNSLAVKLRDRRFYNGALRLDQVKLQFTLDMETGLPSGFNIYEQKDSNRLIEEFMLLANMSVAKQIYETFPEISLLRRHPPPQVKPMKDIVASCEAMGIILDATSSGTLQHSIAQYKGNDYLSKARTELLMNLCSKPMNCALYFCTGVLEEPSMYRHYALNVPLYTHFTSPIRRYPDIIVHRLLGASLHYNPPPSMSATEMQKCASLCNDKKYNAKRVSDLSAEMFLAAFVREMGSVHAKAMVISVMDHSFDCLVLEMGIIKRVYCDKLPLLEKKFQRSHGVSRLNIFWKDSSVESGIEQVLVMFSLVDVILTVDKESLHIKVILNKPQSL